MRSISGDSREAEIRRALEELKLVLRERMERLRLLPAELEATSVELVARDRVGVGPRVLLQDLATGGRLPVARSRASNRDAGGDDGRVHLASPLGRVLLDAAEGDVIELAIGAAPMRLRVLDLTLLADRLDTAGAEQQGARR